MSKLVINTGTIPNDGTGDSLLAGAGKINSNFTEIYSSIGDGTNLGIASFTQLNVSGVSTHVGISTFQSTLFANQLSVSGVATFAGITTVTGVSLFSKQLSVSGVSTFAGITTVTGSTLFAPQLSISGVSTFAGITTVTGVTLFSKQLNVSGVSTFGSDVTIGGNLTVNGTTSTINSTTITVDDKNIELASTASPSDATADGGGITLKGTTDKTFNWVNSTTAWTSSEDLNLLTGKQYEINGTSVLTSTTLGSGVVNSSLTSVGTLGQLNVSGVSTLGVTSATNLTAQQLNVSGVSTLGVTSVTNLTAQQLNVSGLSTFAGITTVTGVSLFTRQLSVSGVSTFAGISTYTASLFGTQASFTGVVTASSFSGNSTSATYATTAGVSTSVIGGIGSVTQLQVSGISTFTNGPVFIGSGTSTGTALQPLQVTGGGYFSGSVGVGTTNPAPGIKLDVLGGEIKAGRVDSSSEGGQVSFGRASDNNTAWYLDVFGSTSTPSLRVVDVTNAAVRAIFDGSGNLLVTGITTVGLGTTSTPPNNSQLSFELTSNTNLRIKVRGTDGVLRSADITLA